MTKTAEKLRLLREQMKATGAYPMGYTQGYHLELLDQAAAELDRLRAVAEHAVEVLTCYELEIHELGDKVSYTRCLDRDTPEEDLCLSCHARKALEYPQ